VANTSLDNLNSWLVRKPRLSPKLRLFCFAYAGGNAMTYQSWQAELGEDIEVCGIQLPGRGNRFLHTPYQTMHELIDAVGAVVIRYSDIPFALFGHSLGALIAFEVARYCQHHAKLLPRHLFVSACEAPLCRSSSRQLHKLGDQQLITELAQYRGTPPEVLGNLELMQLLLPTIRADFSVLETYQYRPGAMLDVPISVFAGRTDHYVDPGAANAWREETRQQCDVRWLSGDHFFIKSHAKEICCVLRTKLEGFLNE
jgi:surfactin synthase thioesterase subunit